MPDEPYQPSPLRRGGPAAIFSFDVRGPRKALVAVTVEHRESGDAMWSDAGSLSALAPSQSVLRLSGLKEELRFRFDVRAGDGPVEVRVLPPEWLPY